ncbi:short-chain fatty acyl-CoA regulator family protein [Tranquillimonas rosea]|uniref:short-chain fatty acyl-CoA regulator family protein n=1 Tax=Tranquillimonas rosea TaxID=641238 RepID=UPI003BAA9B62
MPTRGLTGTRIRARRLDLGLQQAELSRRVGISASYLNLIEHNRRRIGGKLLSDIANALDTDSTQLAEGAEAALLDALRAAAASPGGETAERERAERFAGQFPGWAGLVTAQARRIDTLERAVATLNDRLAHDPFLSASIHDLLSTVTAIRSTSGILAGEEAVDPEWQTRFHRNLYEDSRRLAESAQALVSYLDAGGNAEKTLAAPQEELEAWLSARGHHMPEIEDGAAPAAVVDGAAELSSASSRALALAHVGRYASDAAALPMAPFLDSVDALGMDPAALAARFGVGLSVVLRRLAQMPDDRLPGPVGLVVCDGSGTLTFRKPVAGFDLPRFGAACPLWPLFQALARPMQPIRSWIAPAGRAPQRFLSFAVSEPSYPEGFDGPAVIEAVMLLHPSAVPAEVVPNTVGVSCRICPRAECPARREPSIVAEAG